MILVVDCYLNKQGGAPNFIRQLEGQAHQVTRPPHESLPEIDGWSAVIITGSAACWPMAMKARSTIAAAGQ